MRKVRCCECGKNYDFDVDDFCPRCGAFNQPGKRIGIGADGTVVRTDGLNEKNHAGSFVHREFHAENRVRKAVGLSKGVRRTGGAAGQPSVRQQRKQGRNPLQTLIWVIIFIVFINILSTILGSVFL